MEYITECEECQSEPSKRNVSPSSISGTKRKREITATEPMKTIKLSDEYEPQGLALCKKDVAFSSTPMGEIVAPKAFIDAIKISGMRPETVLGHPKRWSLAANKLYLQTFPHTVRDLKATCYHEHYLSESDTADLLEFCDELTGLQKVRTPEPDGKMLERDTMWYSFVDADGFSTVYRGGSCDYRIPKEVQPRQFKMDADFVDIIGAVKPLLLKIQTEFGENPNHCVITRYNRAYDGINQHTDKTTDLVRGSSIFIFTFGAAKTFRVTHDRRAGLKKKENTVLEFEPASGSLIHMPWDMNQVFEHGVKFDQSKPSTAAFKETREECTDFHTAPRYSITFRSKCTWYNPQTQKSYVDKQVQYSSMQADGAIRALM